MRRHLWPLALAALLSSPSLAIAQAKPSPEATFATAASGGLTLPQAIATAQRANPALRSKQAEIGAADGARADASALFDSNPELSAARTRRSVDEVGTGPSRWNEWSTGLSQRIEIAGQPGYRRRAVERARTALDAEIDDTRLRVRAETTERFYRVLALQQRVELEAQAQRLFDDTASAVQKRRQAGEDTRLDANVARVEAERARNQLAIAEEQLLEARSELATTLQLAPDAFPQVSGDLVPVPPDYRFSDLLQLADAQPRVRALIERESSADARLNLERARRYPDITVGLSVGREGPSIARERLTTFSLSVPLPLFKRNQLGIGQAATEFNQVQIERQTVQRDVRAAVTALWAKLQSLDARVRRLRESVLPALDDNQTLSIKSRNAGQIGLLELIVVNRQGVDARRDLIDALTEYHTTRASLELAAGWYEPGMTR